MIYRYKSLTSVKLQLNFVDLQIELLEDLRLRLAQILRQVNTLCPRPAKYDCP